MYFFSQILNQLRWQDAVDIFLVFIIVYQILLLIRGTRSVSILTGLGLVAIAFFFSDRFGFFTLNYVLRQFFDFLFLIVIILFQDEIRKGLATIGRNPFLGGSQETDKVVHMVNEVVKSAEYLGKKKIGSIIAIEKQHGLKNYMEGSTRVDGIISSEIMISIFLVQAPIHDGAVILQDGRLAAAGCFFPLTTQADLDKNLGTRHRAAVSLSEETDAVIVVTSEERGEISLVQDGKIHRDLDGAVLKRKLLESLGFQMNFKSKGASS